MTRHGGASTHAKHHSSVIKAVSKKGSQSFKYQEVIRKQEAVAEHKRKKEEARLNRIREAKFQRTKQLLLERK